MPWVTDNAVLTAVASVHRFGSASSAPAHWADIVARANGQAYQRIRRVLLERGYAPAGLDTWAEREEFNLRGAMCFALREIGLPEGQEGLSLTNYCKVWDELKEIRQLFDATGSPVVRPNAGLRVQTGAVDQRTAPRVSTGANSTPFGSEDLADPRDGAL